MMRLHACARCGGDLLFEEDVWGGSPTFVCLQCGNTIAPGPPAVVAAPILQPHRTYRIPRRRSSSTSEANDGDAGSTIRIHLGAAGTARQPRSRHRRILAGRRRYGQLRFW